MKKIILFLCLSMFSPLWGQAPDVAKSSTAEKPLVSVTTKRQLLDSDSNNVGVGGKSRSKVFTIRVEVQNTSDHLLENVTLAGQVFINKVVFDNERMVNEKLAKKEIPALKPGEKLTIDLGKITLNKMEFRNRAFEEKLEEWKVECLDGQKIIGSTLSSEKFTKLEVAEKENPTLHAPGPFGKPFRRPGN
jgi:hypothetical protein